jgi:thiol-disulfide isomerase/thioredoxin
MLKSLTLQTKTGENSSVKSAKIILLYFSAHWCPPCRKFTPLLKEFYDEVNEENKQCEIVFISADKTQEEHDKYFAQSHGDWLTVPFDAEDLREQLRTEFGKKIDASGNLVRSGIPCLVVLNAADLSVLTYDGVNDVTSMGSMALEMKWLS